MCSALYQSPAGVAGSSRPSLFADAVECAKSGVAVRRRHRHLRWLATRRRNSGALVLGGARERRGRRSFRDDEEEGATSFRVGSCHGVIKLSLNARGSREGGVDSLGGRGQTPQRRFLTLFTFGVGLRFMDAIVACQWAREGVWKI